MDDGEDDSWWMDLLNFNPGNKDPRGHQHADNWWLNVERGTFPKINEGSSSDRWWVTLMFHNDKEMKDNVATVNPTTVELLVETKNDTFSELQPTTAGNVRSPSIASSNLDSFSSTVDDCGVVEDSSITNTNGKRQLYDKSKLMKFKKPKMPCVHITL